MLFTTNTSVYCCKNTNYVSFISWKEYDIKFPEQSRELKFYDDNLIKLPNQVIDKITEYQLRKSFSGRTYIFGKHSSYMLPNMAQISDLNVICGMKIVLTTSNSVYVKM